MSCCTPPSAGRPQGEHGRDYQVTHSALPPTFTTREIPGGAALLGTDRPLISIDEEGPSRIKTIKQFWMMDTSVTNAMFQTFVEATGYISEAEQFGWSYVFSGHLPAGAKNRLELPGQQWWSRVDGASWRLINGLDSESDWHPEHPVVHVTWHDANAFASWAGGRLPTEVEWEHAARGGLDDVTFPWGEREPDDRNFQPCNIWQGRFPAHNLARDGFVATAPAKSFVANGYGLYNMCGNVWEWTAQPMKLRGRSKASKDLSQMMRGAKLLKGGSFLCHKSYCFRYRIAARTGTTPDTSTAHQGFRLVFDQPPS